MALPGHHIVSSDWSLSCSLQEAVCLGSVLATSLLCWCPFRSDWQGLLHWTYWNFILKDWTELTSERWLPNLMSAMSGRQFTRLVSWKFTLHYMVGATLLLSAQNLGEKFLHCWSNFYFLAHVGFGATFGIALCGFGSCQHVSGM